MERCRDAAFAALAALVLAAAAGCTRSPSAPPEGGTITLALRDSFDTFDPAYAWDPQQTPFLRLVHEGLVAFDDSGRVVPACADRWQVVDGGRTVRFELRRGLRDASGAAVTAEDFARGLARLFRPGPARSPGAPQFAAIAGAIEQGTRRAPPLGIETPDERTLVLRLVWPDPFLLEKLAQPRYALPAGDSVAAGTNGPFRLERADGAYLFIRDPAWGDGLAADDPRRVRAGTLDTIRVLTGMTSRRALLSFESGRIDLLWPLPPEYRDRLLRSSAYGTVEGESDPPRVWHLVLNSGLAPTARRDARRGIAAAINRTHLTEDLGPWIAPWRSFSAGEEDGAATAPGYDPDQARSSLEAARYFTGIRLPVAVPRSDATALALEAIGSGLARGAVQVESLVEPRARWSQSVTARRGPVATILPWEAPARDGLDELAALLLDRGLGGRPQGTLARSSAGAGLDSLLLRGLRESDPGAREALRARIGTLLAGDLPFVPLARVQDAAVFRREIGSVRLHPRGGVDLAAIRRLAPPASLTGNR